MSRACSISTRRCYGLARICRVWRVSRATAHRHRQVHTTTSHRRGPEGAMGDEALGAEITALIKASPFTGEGYRKIWARLRAKDIRTAPRRVNRVMRDLGLLAPHRPVQRPAWLHDGTITTERVDDVWGTDMTQTVTTSQGRAFVFVAVDHCSGEFVGIHAAASASRWEALEPVRQGVSQHFGSIDAGVAKGLTLRHDHGSNYMANDFQAEIRHLGITSSPAFVRQPEGNGVAERAIRTLKEQLLWVQHFATIEELRTALIEFAARYNASWLRQRHGYKTPNQIRVEQKALATTAATEFKLAA